VSIKLTGRGAVVVLFGATFFGLLFAAWTGWSALGDAIFLMACGAVTRYTRPSGLRAVVVSPPLTFFAACVFAQVFTASGGFAIAEGILVTLATSAPWLFIGTGLTIAIAFGRGWRPRLRLPAALTGDLRAAVRDVRPSRTAGNERWVRRRLSGLAGAVGRGGTQVARERERHVLLYRFYLFHGAEPVACELPEHRGDQFLGHRGPAGHAHCRDPVQPVRLDLAGVVDQVGGRRAVVSCHLD
jgi:hypothetical protein